MSEDLDSVFVFVGISSFSLGVTLGSLTRRVQPSRGLPLVLLFLYTSTLDINEWPHEINFDWTKHYTLLYQAPTMYFFPARVRPFCPFFSSFFPGLYLLLSVCISRFSFFLFAVSFCFSLWFVFFSSFCLLVCFLPLWCS